MAEGFVVQAFNIAKLRKVCGDEWGREGLGQFFGLAQAKGHRGVSHDNVGTFFVGSARYMPSDRFFI
jgi:hypothetical protein